MHIYIDYGRTLDNIIIFCSFFVKTDALLFFFSFFFYFYFFKSPYFLMVFYFKKMKRSNLALIFEEFRKIGE